MEIISGNSGRARRFLTGLREKLSRDSRPAPLPGILRGPRAGALIAIAVLVAASSGVAFAESYRGLYEWASHHGLAGRWAAIWPLQVDVFIAVGELALFIALIDGWRKRDRAGAWMVTLIGLAVSVAGNVGHIAAHRLTDRATAAIPPLAAAAALAVGLGVLKRVVATRPAQSASAKQVRRPAVVPSGNLEAARLALDATVAATNPLPERQLVARFGISRTDAANLYREAGLKASQNGSTPDA